MKLMALRLFPHARVPVGASFCTGFHPHRGANNWASVARRGARRFGSVVALKRVWHGEDRSQGVLGEGEVEGSVRCGKGERSRPWSFAKIGQTLDAVNGDGLERGTHLSILIGDSVPRGLVFSGSAATASTTEVKHVVVKLTGD
ncbi:hypothetical protein SUGI_0490790 [Cryptomeria japonica]|nr:hypothetical protein SUGI_0490790 [Cryptomeria japonica]